MGVRAGEIDVALRDGSTVRVRAVREADADALAGLYGGLSERSRIFRFFSAGVDLRKAAERSVASAGSRGGGLVALVEDCVIGHAEYIRYGAEEAEVAFAVADDWQGHGISSLLLVQLAEAAGAVGVTTFSATVMSGNHKMVGVFRGSGFPVEVRAVEGDLEVTFPTALDAAARRRFEDRERAAAVAAVRHVLTPASVALIGAGTPLAAAVERGLDDFGGPLRRVAGGEPVPDGVELAVVTTPAEEVLPAARACAAAGVRALLILSDLVAPTWMQAAPLRAELLSVCRDAGMRLVGPGSLGVLDAAGLHATAAPAAPPRGRVGFASQSAALGLVAIDLAARRGLGLSSFVSLGDKLDLSGNDVLQFWDADTGTDVVALYLESFGNPAKFGRIARRLAERKPVIVVKSGRSPARAGVPLESHTGALVASEAGVDALFRDAGVIRTDALEESFDLAALLVRQPLPRGDRVAVLANARGPGVVAADACAAAGLQLAALAPATYDAVQAAVPRTTVENPLDLASDVTARALERALAAVLTDPGVDAVLVVFVARLAASAGDALEAVRAAAAGSRGIPVVPVLPGSGRAAAADDDLPLHTTVEGAARSLGHAVRYARHRNRPPDPGPDLGTDADRVADLIAAGLAAGGDWLPPPDVEAILACYGIERAPSRWATSARGVRDAALELGGRVAVKASAPGVVHKTEAGAVRLGLTAAGAERAAREMVTVLGGVDGFLVQRMAQPGPELLIGAVGDPRLGPLVAVGAGGTAAELTRDVQVRLAPVGPRTAAEMLRGLRSHPLLAGHRGAPPVDTAAVEDLVVRIGSLAAGHPQIAELDCNPVIASPSGAVVVDARIRLGPPPPRRPLGALDR